MGEKGFRFNIGKTKVMRSARCRQTRVIR